MNSLTNTEADEAHDQQPVRALFQLSCELASRYTEELDAREVVPGAEVLAGLTEFHGPLPLEGTNPEQVIRQLDRVGSPATVASTGGRYFGFVVGGALPVAIAAHWLATAWDQNAGSWALAPGAVELETVAAHWMLEILDLPRDAVVGFVTGSTMGTFSALACARSALLARLNYNVRRRGLAGAPRLSIVVSDEIHPTNLSTLGYLGFGLDDIQHCPTDEQGRIIPKEMPELGPKTIVILQAGNINSGSFDPFEEVCRKAKASGAWVHVDGAFGLWARASTSKRHLTRGIEQADSWSVDGHKWLNLPYDSAIYVCREPEAVQDVFGIDATYLMRNAQRQPNNLVPELSRRSRGVEFWAALKTLGKRGVEDLVDRNCAHARRFAQGLEAAGYEVLNDVVLNQVVFACQDEASTQAALSKIQSSGVTWLGPTTWKERLCMRISVSSWATTQDDVEQALSVMQQAFQREV
ncbi:MAG: aspartate aminotransferase family protein [Planctomycetes bacterium]|nr:aspartate aminotransferase family protein [Planctomycetota bacterium]